MADLLALHEGATPAAVFLASYAGVTRRTMRSGLRTVAALLPGAPEAQAVPWEELRFEHLAHLRARLAERYAPATANRCLAAVRGVLRAAWQMGRIDQPTLAHALAGLRGVPGSREPAGRMLSLEELRRLFAAAEDPRARALLAVTYGAGLRCVEVARLAVADWDGQLLRVLGKRNKERLVPLPPRAAEALTAWCQGQDPGPMFPRHGRHMNPGSVARLITAVGAKAGVPFTAHDLRRTYISTLLDGTDVATVAALVGHSEPKTTMRYDRRGDERKRAAVAKLPGLE